MNQIIEAPSRITTVFGSKAWAKRENEPPEAWFAFTTYLHSKEPNVHAWIDNLTEDDKEILPKGFKGVNKLRNTSSKFQWQLRKNDYFNEVVLSAQRKHEYQMEKTGGNINSIVNKLGILAERTLDKKIEDFHNGKSDLTINQVIALIKIHADYHSVLVASEAYRKKRVDLKNTPVQDIKSLLSQINKLNGNKKKKK